MALGGVRSGGDVSNCRLLIKPSPRPASQAPAAIASAMACCWSAPAAPAGAMATPTPATATVIPAISRRTRVDITSWRGRWS